MSRTDPPLSDILPRLVLGTATFNTQYNSDPHALPVTAIVSQALQSGIRAFDTSPYYGPSESLLGNALSDRSIRSSFPRESYFILTKVGRISSTEFDYSPEWVRKSVRRSLARLKTTYLDVVYLHDVEFMTLDDVVAAVEELGRIRDKGWDWLMRDAHSDDFRIEGDIPERESLNKQYHPHPPVRYIGISGYPLDVLVHYSTWIRIRWGKPLDIVQTYAHYSLLNASLENRAVVATDKGRYDDPTTATTTTPETDVGLSPLEKLTSPSHGAVSVVTNGSILALGLLRSGGLVETAHDWHPAPYEMRQQVQTVGAVLQAKSHNVHLDSNSGITLEDLSLWFSFFHFNDTVKRVCASAVGISVIGVSSIEELDHTAAIWNDAHTSKAESDQLLKTPDSEISPLTKVQGFLALSQEEKQNLTMEIRDVNFGPWKDVSWESPPTG